MNFNADLLQQIGQTFLICAGVSLLLGSALIVIAIGQMRKINIPPDADFNTTMQLTPLLVVLGIDMLDFALDFLAAPIAWIILDTMGLKALRNVSAIEALIPFTQPIPTLTLAWLAVRVLGIRF
jgi:hypothetical protein